MIFELAQDFHDAVAAMPRGHPKHRMLELLEEAIRRDIHFIARHPTTLFQCMWNTCWWYDCPEAAKHYLSADGPWSHSGVRLHNLLEAWRKAKETSCQDFFWICALRPPALPLGTAPARFFPAHGKVNCLVVSRDGSKIVGGDLDLPVWNAATGRELLCLRGHRDSVNSVAFSRDGCKVVTGASDRTTRVWSVETGEEGLRLAGFNRTVSFAAFKDGRILTGCWDGRISMWNDASGEEALCLREDGEIPVAYAACSSDGHRMAGGPYRDRSIRVWDTERAVELLCWEAHDERVTSVAFSHDDRWIASGGMDHKVRVWDSGTGERIWNFEGHDDGVHCVAFSNDSRFLASGSSDKTVCVWDMSNGRMLNRLQGHDERVTCVAFMPNGCQLLSGSLDETIRLWDLGAADAIRSLSNHQGYVENLAYSPDGTWLASGSWDKTVRLWDARSGLTRVLSKRT